MKNVTFIFKSNNTGKLNVATLSSLYRVGKSNISNSPFVSSECLAAMTSIAAHKNAFKSFFMLVRRSQKVKSNQHFFFSLVKSAFKYAVGFVRINDKFKYKKVARVLNTSWFVTWLKMLSGVQNGFNVKMK